MYVECLCLLLFIRYVATLAKVTECFGAQHHQYVDDTYLYIFASMEELTMDIQTTERCAHALYNWLSHNGLALNPSKLEVIQFSVSQARYIKNVAIINVAGTLNALSPSIRASVSLSTLNWHLMTTWRLWARLATFTSVHYVTYVNPFLTMLQICSLWKNTSAMLWSYQLIQFLYYIRW